MGGKKAYEVVVPLVIAKSDSGDLYLYAGAPVPEGLSEDEVARLLEGAFIAEVGEPAEDPAADEAPSESWNHDRIDAWAAKQDPVIEFTNPDPSKALTKAQKLEQIAAAKQ